MNENKWSKLFAGVLSLCLGVLITSQVKAERILDNPMDADIYKGWDKINQEGGTITLKKEAAQTGEKGAEIQLTTPGKGLSFYRDLQKDYKRLNIRFYLRLNNDLDLNNSEVTLYNPCSSDWGQWMVHCILRQQNGEFALSLVDPIAWFEPGKVKLEKGKWYCVEIEAASGAPGSLKLYLDGKEEISIPNNYDFKLGHITLGPDWKHFKGTPKGSIDLDEIVIDDSGYIGPVKEIKDLPQLQK